jgi:glutamine amidotransferase
MIGIIDYGMGNLRSVQKAFEHVGADAVLLNSPDQSPAINKLILPGVGAFADGMEQLRQRGWVRFIEQFVATGQPFLGICLGMQLLFDASEEDAPTPDQLVPGLGILPGKVLRLREDRGGQRLKVPHMGWNTLNWTRPDPLFATLPDQPAVYFVHSYYVQPDAAPTQPSLTIAEADYGGPFCAAVQHNNIWATQFHPEKSQRIGMKILSNFAAL